MSVLADPVGTLVLVGGAVTSVSALAHQLVGIWSVHRVQAEQQQTIRQVAGALVQAQSPGAVAGVRYATGPGGAVTVEVVRSARGSG